jgi:hypothetical protein
MAASTNRGAAEEFDQDDQRRHHNHMDAPPANSMAVNIREPANNATTERVDPPQQAATEPRVPEVFKAQKAGKVKVDEGQSAEGKEKPFCFRCYKPGHEKLECTAKPLCDICSSTDHLTGKCPILKQPRLLAHPCGYDVSGLGFYHIPHVSITLGKPDNRTALVTVQGGELSIPQLVAELSRLIPERWHWNVTQQDKQSFVFPFPSRGDLQRSVAFGKADIKEHGVRLLFEEWNHVEEGQPLQRVWNMDSNFQASTKTARILGIMGIRINARCYPIG